MSNLAPLLDRNQAFASTDARQNMPPLPFIPRLNLYIVTCIDPGSTRRRRSGSG
jgi:carbonic anhydrase